MNPFDHPNIRFLLRNYVEVLTCLILAFVLQTGLVPFDFLRQRAERGSYVFFSIKTSYFTFPDVVSNIFLYVPVGILVHWTLTRRPSFRLLALPATLVVAAALTGFIEWAQAYSPIRISSLIDFVSNMTGAALGASISWIFRRGAARFFRLGEIELRERPHSALLKTYFCLLVVFAAIPYSFSFSSIRLKKAVKSANFIPFATVESPIAAGGDAAESAPLAPTVWLRWEKMKRWSRWAAECTSFAVLAWLIQFVPRSERRHRGTLFSPGWWFISGILLAGGLSFLQLMIISRACDVTDVLFRLLGLVLGGIIGMKFIRTHLEVSPTLQIKRWRKIAATGCLATIAYIAYTGVIPWPLVPENRGFTIAVFSKSFLPFFGHLTSRFDVLMSDVMEKVAAYVILGALLSVYLSGLRRFKIKSPLMTIVVAGVVLSSIIEFFQIYVPARVTSMTDPILAAGGCLVGVLTQQTAAALYHQAALRANYVPRKPTPSSRAAPQLSPTDALVASLSDPPVEPERKRRRRTHQPSPHRRRRP